MFKKILYVVGGLLFVVAIVASVGFGVWSYRLNSQLSQAQADYQELESEYSKLSTEYSDAKAEFEIKSDQANADLEKALAEATKLESDVKKLQSENNRYRTKMAEIQDKVAMLSDFWFLSDSMYEDKVAASDDEQLKELYAKMQQSDELNDFIEFMSYMIKSIDEVSRGEWQPLAMTESVVEVGISQ